MQTTPLHKYFFAGAAAALALILFAWHNGYSAGFKTSAVPTQTAPPQLLSGATSVSGKIIDITDTVLTITAPDSTPVIRKVLTDPGTVFGLKVLKDQKTFQSDILAFDLKLKTAQINGTPVSPGEYPTPFTFKKIFLSDLRKGDMVTITATGAILSKGEFTAMSVIAQDRSTQ